MLLNLEKKNLKKKGLRTFFRADWEYEPLTEIQVNLYIAGLQTLSVWKSPKICRLGKGYYVCLGRGHACETWRNLNISLPCRILTLSQKTNFGLFQAKRVCRRQIRI